MEYDLTDEDKKVLKWLVEEQKAGRLDRRFLFIMSSSGSPIADYQGEVIQELSLAVLESLASAKLLRSESAGPYARWYTILPPAYTLIESNFGATAQPQVQAAQIRELLTKLDAGTLSKLMSDYFSDAEIQLLCPALDVDYENIAGDGKRDRILKLIQHLDRRSYRERLIDAILKERPNVDWSPPLKD